MHVKKLLDFLIGTVNIIRKPNKGAKQWLKKANISTTKGAGSVRKEKSTLLMRVTTSFMCVQPAVKSGMRNHA
jgi:hypothetical protein